MIAHNPLRTAQHIIGTLCSFGRNIIIYFHYMFIVCSVCMCDKCLNIIRSYINISNVRNSGKAISDQILLQFSFKKDKILNRS